MFGKLNLVSPDLLNVLNVEAPRFTGKTEKAEGLINSEEDKGAGTMEGIIFRTKYKTGILFCPRCGLRRPKDEIAGYYGGYCPVCGCRMVEEGLIPYFPFSGLKVEYDVKNKIRRESYGKL